MTSKSSITTRKKGTEELLPLITPGEVLNEEFLKPFNLSMNALAKELNIPANRIMAILKNQRSITADTALRLARYFGTSAEFWMNLQQNYDLARARRDKLAGIEGTVTRRPPAKQEPFTKRRPLRHSGD